MVDTSVISDLLAFSLDTVTLEKLFTTLLILVVCLICIRIVGKIMQRIMDKLTWDPRVERYIVSGVKALLYILTVLIVADNFGIPVTSLIALVSVFGLAISLAVQDILSNIAGGLVILFSKPFELGDYIATDSDEGTVAEISLTHTKLDTFDGQRTMLPNSKLVAGKITNFTTRGVRRVNHGVNVSCDCSTADVRKACLKAVSRTNGVLPDPEPSVVIGSYGESYIEFRIRFWATNEDYWDAYFQSLEEIRTAFAEEGIAMTYNQMKVQIVEK